MHAPLPFLLASTAIVSMSSALGVPSGRGFIHLPLTRGGADAAGRPPARRTPGRRAGAPARTALDNDLNSDLVSVTVGGQAVSVLLDTGSFELWVNPDCASVSPPGQHSASATALCEASGRYDPAASGTSVRLGEGFSALYGRGSANGTYFSDDLGVAGVTVRGQRFAVANASAENPTGILGLGPDPYGGFNTSEPDLGGANLDTYMASPYSLLLTSMVSQGLISSRAFSLDMGNLEDPTGSLIFGGVDMGRFRGTLRTFPLVTESGAATLSNGTRVEIPLYAYECLPMRPSYYVNATSYSLTLPGSPSVVQPLNSPEFTSYPVIDSGTTYLYLPGNLLAQTCSALSGSVKNGLCYVDCHLATASGGLNVDVVDDGDTTTFQIPYSNLVFPPAQPSSATCGMLMAQTTGSIPALLGTPFLRSVYAVFDWDNRQVSLGQKANCTSDVVAIGRGSDAVPTTGGCSAAGGTGSSEGLGDSGARRVASHYAVVMAVGLLTALLVVM